MLWKLKFGTLSEVPFQATDEVARNFVLFQYVCLKWAVFQLLEGQIELRMGERLPKLEMLLSPCTEFPTLQKHDRHLKLQQFTLLFNYIN